MLDEMTKKYEELRNEKDCIREQKDRLLRQLKQATVEKAAIEESL